MKIKITNKLTKKQQSQAIKLFVKYFPVRNKKDGTEHFTFYLNNTLKKKMIIAQDEKSNLLGIYILLNRKISFFGCNLKVINMSYLVVKDQKNFSITKKIIDVALNYVNKNSDVSVQILRRIMNHYWTRHGYIGFANFNDFIINKSDFCESSNLKIEKLNEQNLINARYLYNKHYKDQPLGFIRDKRTWVSYLRYLNKKKIEAFVIKSKTKPVAYTIFNNNVLRESVIQKGFEKKIFSLIFNLKNKDKNLTIQLSGNHPIIKNLRNYSHTENLRYVNEGGHIIKIHDFTKFIKKIRPVIQKRLKKIIIGNFEICLNKFKFIWKDQRLKILINKKRPDYFLDNTNLTKLFLGILDPEEILNINNKKIQILKIMFPKLFPHLVYMDQLI
jgi:predicted acetyltransferase